MFTAGTVQPVGRQLGGQRAGSGLVVCPVLGAEGRQGGRWMVNKGVSFGH